MLEMNKLGNAASFLGLILSLLQITNNNSQTIVFSFCIIALFFVLLIIFGVTHNKTKHYLEALSCAQDLHYDIICSYKQYEGYTLEKSIHELTLICDQISKILNQLKNINSISVCIKYININKDKYYTRTLCRDPFSYNKRKNKYDDNNQDLIDKNTDFEEILTKINKRQNWKDVYYFSNFLPQKHNYNNTHLVIDNLPDNIFSFISRNRKWPLLYKSTIVVPILSDNNRDIYGFLCVDSCKNKGFNGRFDIRLAQNFALYISPIIRLVSQKHLINNGNI